MITISGLTKYQVEMLDHMWSLDSEEEYLTWYNLLDEEDQKMADTLMQMIVVESLDEEPIEISEEVVDLLRRM